MPADTTNYRYKGDYKKCLRLKPIAQEGVLVIGMLMSYGNLNTYQIKRVFEDGSYIRIWSAYGATYAEIFGVPSKKEQEVVEEEEINYESPVMVYVGSPNNPLSKYTVKELTEQSVKLWNTYPDISLEKLASKRLLVLPCPKRALTTAETEAMLSFLEGKETRIAVFSGTDFTSTNAVLASLKSKLQCIAYEDSKTELNLVNLSGYLPLKGTDKFLFHILVKEAGYVVVHPDYWNTAVVKDWNGYGVMYNDITNMCPARYYYLPTPSSAWADLFVHTSNYAFSTALVYDPDIPPGEEGGKFWDIAETWYCQLYPSTYITWSYTGKDEVDVFTWCVNNASYMPFIYVHCSIPTSTAFLFGRYFDYSESATIKNARVQSYLAYADNEKIIVGSFEPVFLSGLAGYSNSVFNKNYTAQDFADWLLMYDMTPSKDMFNTNGCFVLDMPWLYSLLGSSPYFPGVQY